jgi:hypothetical protein
MTLAAGPSGADPSHSIAPPSDGMRTRAKTEIERSDRNAARTSCENSCDSSQAAKCPPLSTWL